MIIFTITAEIQARSMANFYCQYADRHMNLKFMRRVGERELAIRQFVIVKNKLMSVFNASVLLLIMNFVITLSKQSADPLGYRLVDYKITEPLRELSLVDRCVQMRVCKHGYDVLDSRVFLRIILSNKQSAFFRVYITLDQVSSLHNCFEFSQPSSCLDGAM